MVLRDAPVETNLQKDILFLGYKKSRKRSLSHQLHLILNVTLLYKENEGHRNHTLNDFVL